MTRILLLAAVACALLLLGVLSWSTLAPGPPADAAWSALDEETAGDPLESGKTGRDPSSEAHLLQKPEEVPPSEPSVDGSPPPALEAPGEPAPPQPSERVPVLRRATKHALPPRDLRATASAALALRRKANSTANRGEAAALNAKAAALERKVGVFVRPLLLGRLDREAAMAVLSSGQALADRFATPSTAVVIDGASWARGEPLPEHAVLRFPKGIARFRPEDVTSSSPRPKTVVVEGAGMDATALVGWSRWNAHADGPRWTFRNCTIHCGDNEFVHGGGPAEFRLEGVRVVGCDTGAGGSEMVDAPGLFVAVDCRFEQGFGHSPGHVNLFDDSDLFVRLDRCTFVGPFSRFSNSRALVVATNCTFEWTHTQFSEYFKLATTPDGEASSPRSKSMKTVSLIDCVVESIHDGRRWPRRQLVDLNPNWTDARR